MDEEWFDTVINNWSGILGQAMRGNANPLVQYLTAVQVIESVPVLDLVLLFPLAPAEYEWAVGDEPSDEFRSRVAFDLEQISRHLGTDPSAWRHTVKTIRFAHAARSGGEAYIESIVEPGEPAPSTPAELRYVALASGGEVGTLLLAVGTPDRVRWVGRAPSASFYHPMITDLVNTIIERMIGPEPLPSV